MSEKLIARASTVIKLTDSAGSIFDITIQKGSDIIDGINWGLPLIGVDKKLSLGEAPQSEWISVDDRFPVNGAEEMKCNYEQCEVIVSLDDGMVTTAEFQCGKTVGFWCGFAKESKELSGVTHWMPLPPTEQST